MAKILLQYTKNYDLFIRREDNRDVNDERHIKNLMESMERNGFIQSKAISVINEGTKYVILDGQHRAEAAKRLGIAIWYNIDDKIPETALPDLQIAKKWLPKDYLKHFVIKGVKSYVKLQELHEKYPKVSITTIVLMLEDTLQTAGSRKRFETGTIKISKLDKAIKVLQYIEEMYKLYKHDWMWGRAFLMVFMVIMDIEGYDQKILMKRLQVSSENFRQMVSEEGYFKMISSIYNHRATANRIKFERPEKMDGRKK